MGGGNRKVGEMEGKRKGAEKVTEGGSRTERR